VVADLFRALVPDLVGPMTAGSVVVHVVHSLGTGGLENGVVNLVNNAKPRFRHVIVCMTTQGVMRDRLRPDVEVFALGKRPGQDLAALLRLVRLIRRLRPAIVHSRNWAAFDAVPAARLAGVRFLVHGEHGREAADPEGLNARRNRIRRLLAPLVSHFVTVSRDLRRWLVEDVRVPAHKVSTIPNGVDLTRFSPGGRREAREALGLPADGPVVGTVGRLDPVKDHAGLVRAFATLMRAYPDAVLVVAGDGPCHHELAGLVTELGAGRRVRLLGERRDVPQLLTAMDLFVLPSIAEGMSNTILEAMATGLPVVATKVGGTQELVEDGATGRLVPPKDPRALAEAIAGYLDDPHLRTIHGKASRQRVSESFGLDGMCHAYENVYGRLLAGRGPEQS
jgi:sugar transferase (PEP-CTERM/EpsH1 system associated)